ncbi:MAG TPA: tetratricopeptide repeat protein, partial [Patescibacteria group bacterium]|nr:tetratricopeptide repeat protein [Patescibacteria group bacterium]
MSAGARVGVICALWTIGALGTAWAAAQGEAGLFAEGNRHYAASEFEEAAKDYRQLLNQGFTSEAIHYNLGNALFK